MRQFVQVAVTLRLGLVSALHIPVGVGHRWIHGASTLSCVKWHPVESQDTTPSTTSSHVRLPQPRFQSGRNLLVSFVVTANALMVWRWYLGKEVRPSRGKLQSLPRWQTPIFRSLDPQLAPQAEMAASRKQDRVVSVPADCCGNSGPNQRISCTVLKRSGSQIHFCLYRWQGGAISLPTTLSLCSDSTPSCCMSRLKVLSTRTFTRPGFLNLLSF